MLDALISIIPYVGYILTGTAALVWFVNSRFFGPLDDALGSLAERLL